MSDMQAMRVGGKRGSARMQRVDLPVEASGCAIVRMVRASVSHADLRTAVEYRGADAITMGHEGVGVVESVAPGCDGSLVGARVTFEASLPCKECELCRKGLSAHCRSRCDMGEGGGFDGCFSELFSVPVSMLVRLPDSVDDERAAQASLFARAHHASQRVRIDGRPYITVLGDNREALVMGQVLARLNAQVRVIGWDEGRLALCEKWGVRSRLASEPGLHEDQDVVVDCSGGVEAIELAMAMIRPRGVILSTVPDGLSIHASALVVKELDVLGTTGGSVAKGVSLLEQAEYSTDGLVTKRVKLDDAVVGGVHALHGGELGILIEF